MIMNTEENKDLNLDKLENSYHEGETCDRDVLAEMKSNILIMSGQHYRRTVGRGLERSLRDANVKQSKRIRLVKNHTQKAINDAKDIVASMVPGVLPYPTVEGEIRHQKSAEIVRQIWNHSKEANKWEAFREQSIDNFFELGEVCSKIYYNPLKGGLKGFKQKVELIDGEEKPLYKTPDGKLTTEPGLVNEFGQMVQEFEMCPDDTKPEFHGQVVIERFAPFDLLRCKSAKDMNESPWLIYRKMIANDTLKALIKKSTSMSDDEKDDAIEALAMGKGSTFRVFNSGNGTFEEQEDHTLLKEKYFRQCPKYPKGYFVIWTEHGKLFEGVIPFGEHGDIAFPIKWEGHDRFESSARGFSPIKRVRPAQLEANRCASKIVEHHLTVGDDKVVLSKGAKFERGVDHPGIRVFYTTGTPQYFQGKSGEQFVGFLEHNIAEIYKLLGIDDNRNPSAQGFEPKAELFKMQRQKIKFSKPAGKLERYFKDVANTYLFLEQKYMTPERFELVVGQGEAVNFEEFEQIDRLDYQVKLEEISGDLETMMGKTMELETIMHYSGKDLDEQTRVSLLMQFPILNRQQAFKHVTIHHKNIESDILQLERGTYVPARKRDNHELMLSFLTSRMSQKDFGRLDPQIQEMFEAKAQEHEQVMNQQAEELRAASAGMIPTSGNLVRADVYVNDDPNNPEKTSRMEVPNDALMWLKENMEKQGLYQQRLQEIKDVQSNINILQSPQGPPPMQGEMGPMMPDEMF